MRLGRQEGGLGLTSDPQSVLRILQPRGVQLGSGFSKLHVPEFSQGEFAMIPLLVVQRITVHSIFQENSQFEVELWKIYRS